MGTKQKIVDLPTYANVFIGRMHHINFICSLLQKDETRLINLLGPGGMGKTRLSVKIGEQLIKTFEHGVIFIPLDVVTDHEQVPLYIGQFLGLKESFNNSWIDEIINFLANKQLLLILDNLEQILESSAVIDQIIHACPTVKILTTSRETLGLSYEIEYHLDSLNRPNPNLFPEPKDLLKFDAIDLFVQKARATVPGFQFNEDNAGHIVQICHELEGLPLPIELAAARVKLFSPELILKKLRSNLSLLKTNAKDVILRHQTIQNTVKWSYDLLDKEEQQLFQQLSLFRNGFTPSSLEVVCPEFDSLEVIESFINKNLIVKGKEVHYIPRFRMLKLIRDYGMELLENNPGKDTFYHNFVQYFISFVDEGIPKLQSSEQGKWIAFFEAEYENFTVALEWLIANHPEEAGKMGSSLWKFHNSKGFLREGLEMIETLLSLSIKDKSILTGLLEGAGVISQNLGKYLVASDYFKRYLKLCQELQDKSEIIKALNNMGWAAWRIGNYDQTIDCSERALEISTELADLQGQAKSLNNLAWIYLSRGFFEKAAQLQRKVMRLQLKINNKRGIAFAKTNLGRALLYAGKLIEAEQNIKEGIQLFQELNHQQLTAYSWMIKAELLVAKNKHKVAAEILLTHCLPSFEAIGDVWGIAYSHNQLGSIFLQQKDFKQSKFHLTQSMELLENSHDELGKASTSLWLSKWYWATGNKLDAEEYLYQSLNLATSMEANQLLMNVQLELGLRNLEKKAYKAAEKCFTLADQYAQKLGAFQYKQFLTQIQPVLNASKPLFHLKRIDIEPLSLNDLAKDIEKIRMKGALAGESEDPFIARLRQVIHKHLSEPDFTVKDLCRIIGVSHSQLHRKLSTLTGQSTTNFIRSIRLNKAKELLLNPKNTVAAVAYDTGFREPEYFYRVFKKAFKMTPKEFRNAGLQKSK